MGRYCSRCDRHFAVSQGYQAHLNNSRSHNICPCCGDDYRLPIHLDRHVHRDHYPCEFCDNIYRTKKDRNVHMEDKHDCCEPCKRQFLDNKQLREHIDDVHRGSTTTPKEPVKCVCGTSFPALSSLASHIEERSCTIITDHLFRHVTAVLSVRYGHRLSAGTGPLFTNPTETLNRWVIEHALGAMNAAGSMFKCFCCEVEFNTQMELISHFYGDFAREPLRYECKYCKAMFERPSGVLSHMESGRC